MKKINIKTLAGDELLLVFKPTKKKFGIKSVYKWHLDIDKIKTEKTNILNTFKNKNGPEIYQTRSPEKGFVFHRTILNVLEEIKKDDSIDTISFFSYDQNKIVTLFKENNEWTAKIEEVTELFK